MSNKQKKVSVSKSFQAFFNTLNKRETARVIKSSTEEKSVVKKSNNKATTQEK